MVVKSETGSQYNFREHEIGKSAPVESKHFQPIGTEKSGYAPPKAGPFRCDNCVHYLKIEEDEGTCDHPDVIADAKAKQPGLELGKEDGKTAAVVEPAGCCDYFKTGKHEAGSKGMEIEEPGEKENG